MDGFHAFDQRFSNRLCGLEMAIAPASEGTLARKHWLTQLTAIPIP